MPKKVFRRKKSYKKKRYSRKVKKLKIPYGPPQHQLVKLRYREALNAPSATYYGVLGYAANGIYDPQTNASGWGSISGIQNNAQPLFRDQLATMYYGYRVMGSKLKVSVITTTASATNAGTTPPCMMAFYPSNAVTTDTDPTITAERPGAKSTIFGGANFSTRQRQSLTLYQKPWKCLGLTKRQYLDDPATAGGLSTGSNPSQLALWTGIIRNLSTSDDCKWYVLVEIEYLVHVFDVIDNVAAS